MHQIGTELRNHYTNVSIHKCYVKSFSAYCIPILDALQRSTEYCTIQAITRITEFILRATVNLAHNAPLDREADIN